MDDAALVRLAREGDREAFAVLLARHRGMLLALCRRALGDDGLAEDAAQEAALEALLRLDRLRQPERFGSWLAGIGLNVCRRWRREQARESWSLAAVTGGRAGPGVDPPAAALDERPEEAAEAAEAARRVRLAVGRLPAGQRAAVVLFHLVGLAHREVAALLGIRVGAVKTRLHKGRVALRGELQGWWKEDGMGAQTTTGPVPMRVAQVRRQPAAEGRQEQYAVLLEEEEAGPRRLCIWIGSMEATQIAFALEGAELPRPMAYQFMSALLEATGGRLAEARVTRLDGGTFYTAAVVEGSGGTRELDARPSDALNLALVVGAPIRVDPPVLEAAWAGRGAARFAEAEAYPDGAAAIVAEWQVHLEELQRAAREEHEP